MAHRATTADLEREIGLIKNVITQGTVRLKRLEEQQKREGRYPHEYKWLDNYVLKKQRELKALEKRLEKRTARQGPEETGASPPPCRSLDGL